CTNAPSGLSHRLSVASVIDSPARGTRTCSSGMNPSRRTPLARLRLAANRLPRAGVGLVGGLLGRGLAVGPVAGRAVAAEHQVRDLRAERRVHQFVLLDLVDVVRPGRRAGAGVAADVLERE